MAPIKFEEHIREKLQERELQPSEDAWGKLASQLEDEPEKKNGMFFWMAVAASFIGILLVVGFVFKAEQTSIEDKYVEKDFSEEIKIETLLKKEVHTNTIKEEVALIPSVTIETEKKKASTQIVDNTKSTQSEIATNTFKTPKSETVKQEILKIEKTIVKEEMIAISTKEEIESSKKEHLKATLGTNNDFVNHKVNEVVASVKSKKEITAEDIDVLLANAQKDIAMQRILSQEKVDAMALLEDVEMELDKTFRDRVFYALGEGFEMLRSTVVDREH